MCTLTYIPLLLKEIGSIKLYQFDVIPRQLKLSSPSKPSNLSIQPRVELLGGQNLGKVIKRQIQIIKVKGRMWKSLPPSS